MERLCISVLFCLLLAHKSESKYCQIGWTTFSDDGLCYKFSPDLETFDQAVATCSGLNASLTAVKTNAQQDFVVSLIPQSATERQFWIGLGKNDTGLFWLIDGTAYDDQAVSYGSVPFDNRRCWFTIDGTDSTWGKLRCGRVYRYPTFCVKLPSCTIATDEADCPSTTTPRPTTSPTTTTQRPTTATTPTTTTPQPTTTKPTTTPQPTITTTTTSTTPHLTTATTPTTTPQPTTATTPTTTTPQPTTITQLLLTVTTTTTSTTPRPTTTIFSTPQMSKSTQTTTMIPSMPTDQFQITTSQVMSTPGVTENVTNTKSMSTNVIVSKTTPFTPNNTTSSESFPSPTGEKTHAYQATTVKVLLADTKKQTGNKSKVAGAAAGSVIGVLMLAGGIGLVVVVARYMKKKRSIAEDEKV